MVTACVPVGWTENANDIEDEDPPPLRSYVGQARRGEDVHYVIVCSFEDGNNGIPFDEHRY
jgi:hypothetical protein